MQTQNDRLLAYLRERGRINPLEAWERLGIYRLGARVFDLREQGHKIEKTSMNVKNRFGEKCRVAEYFLNTGGNTA